MTSNYMVMFLILNILVQVLMSVSKTNPIILYIRDVENLFFRSQRMYSLFQKMLTKLSGRNLILGSRMLDLDSDCKEVDGRLAMLFPYNIEIKPPEDETHLAGWKSQLEEDMKMIQIKDNRNHIAEVLIANNLECDDLSSICLADTMLLSNYIEEIVLSAVSYHLMNNKDPQYRNGKLVISSKRSVKNMCYISVGSLLPLMFIFYFCYLTMILIVQFVPWIELIS